MIDPIDRQAAIEVVHHTIYEFFDVDVEDEESPFTYKDSKLLDLNKAISTGIKDLPTVTPTLYGYNIEHLKLIAEVLIKENLPPERVFEALTDISRIISIVKTEFTDALRKAVCGNE